MRHEAVEDLMIGIAARPGKQPPQMPQRAHEQLLADVPLETKEPLIPEHRDDPRKLHGREHTRSHAPAQRRARCVLR